MSFNHQHEGGKKGSKITCDILDEKRDEISNNPIIDVFPKKMNNFSKP